MNFKTTFYALIAAILLTSCVSKQKYAQLQNEYKSTSNELLRYKAQNIDLEHAIASAKQVNTEEYVNKAKMYIDGVLASMDWKSINTTNAKSTTTRITLRNLTKVADLKNNELHGVLKAVIDQYILKNCDDKNMNYALAIEKLDDAIVIEMDYDFFTKDKNPKNMLKIVTNTLASID